MKSKDRAIRFEKELKALLKKYKTQICMEEEYTSPYVCPTYTINVQIQGDYEGVQDNTIINLGSYYDGE